MAKDPAPNTGVEFLEEVSEEDSLELGVRLAVSQSAHLTSKDTAAVRALLYIAREFDKTLPNQRYEVGRNLGPTLLKYLDALGLTPTGRKAAGLVADLPASPAGEGDELEQMQNAQPGLRVVE